MANFLTWATDVLQAVDQSAASLSDSGQERQRRPRPSHGAGGPRGHVEGQLSDSGWLEGDGYASGSGYGSDLAAADRHWMSDQDGAGGAHSPLPKAALPPRGPMRLGGAATGGAAGRPAYRPGQGPPGQVAEGEGPATSAAVGAGGGGGSMRHVYAFEAPIDRNSALHAAREPSAATESLRAVRREMVGATWQQEDVRRGFEEAVRSCSEVEAQVSALAAEIERGRKAGAVLAAVSAQELESLRGEADAAALAREHESKAHAATRLQELEEQQRHLDAQLRNLQPPSQVAAGSPPSAPGQAPVTAPLVAAAGGAGGGESEATRQRRSKESPQETLERRQEEADDRQRSELETAVHATRQELVEWEARVRQLAAEVETHLQNAARWPSTSHVKCRSCLTCRAVAAQAQTLGGEKATLQLRLQRTQDARRQLQAGGDAFDVDPKRNKISRSASSNGPGGGGGNNSSLPWGVDDPSGKLRRPRGAATTLAAAQGVSENMARVARSVDNLSLRASMAVQRNSFVRTLVIIYILGLHLAVFAILSLAAAHKALSSV
eukprot:jgi/Mesen1/6181/ME000032S05473